MSEIPIEDNPDNYDWGNTEDPENTTWGQELVEQNTNEIFDFT